MPQTLEGMKIAILATDGVERVELTEPLAALRAAGADAKVVSIKTGVIQAMDKDVEPSQKIPVDFDLSVNPAEFDGLVLPGGTTNPDKLRMEPRAVEFVRRFVVEDKPIAAICHGPWMLVETDAVEGITLTSWPSLRTDIENAGGEWIDQPMVRDGSFVTSRKPDDLPAFCEAMIELFAETYGNDGNDA